MTDTKRHVVASENKDALWKQYEPVASLFANRATNVKKTRSLLMEMARVAFMTGLDTGYDMGAHVFGDDGKGQ